MQVSLERQVDNALEEFERRIVERPEVMECYLMTGDSDYLLRVVAPDLDSFQRFLLEHLTRIPGVGQHQVEFRPQAGQLPHGPAAGAHRG